MTTVETSRTARELLTRGDVRQHPYPFYRKLREDDPFHRASDAVLVARSADIVPILGDPEAWSSDTRRSKGTEGGGPLGGGPAAADERSAQSARRRFDAFAMVASHLMLGLDPPDHTRLRRLVNRAFTPRAVSRLRPHITEIVDSLLSKSMTDGRLELLSEFAYPLPVIVIAEMLGVPPDDRDKFTGWARGLARALDPGMSEEVFAEAADAALGFGSYISDLVVRRRSDPRDDLLSAMISAREEDGDRLSDTELVANAILLLVAGHETTMNLIGNGTLALLRHPDQLAALRAEPVLAKAAAEELLRYDSPVQLTARFATRPLRVGPHDLDEGDAVIVLLGSANRDRDLLPDGESLNISREPPHHLGFGHGIHFCLGAALARLEGELAFEALAAVPTLELLEAAPTFRDTFTLRGLERLELAVTPAGAAKGGRARTATGSGTDAEGDADWGLPGSRRERRIALYSTALKVAARYLALALPFPKGGLASQAARWWADESGARDLHTEAVRLRGGFLKLGQFVSARPDLLPEAYVRELSKLQDRVPPAPAAVIRRIIGEDIGPVDDHFRDFDIHSASAASLAQVHQAVRTDGRKVAVKVQYPGVAEIVPAEMADTRRIFDAVSKVVQGIGLDTIGQALDVSISMELDYVMEAANIERFAANFAAEPAIVVPGVHHDLSHGRVLVMDWIEGENLAIALREADRETAEEAVRLLVDAFLKQILDDGFMHADPHPGNFLLQPGPKLGIVDFGACATISDTSRLALRRIYRAGLTNDLAEIITGLHDLGLRTKSGDAAGLLGWASLFDSSETKDPTATEDNFRKLVQAARNDPVTHIPDELVLLGRVLIVQTGLVAGIDPSWTIEDLIAAHLGDPD